ncbi:MAG: AbrB/MazE/SpoVT family DNA-binding domain-containing protein [Spirochaetaceae bacterium]|nr:AbrB/MazE/SpoVT family DNA-binding domain-containing protein [Spirochaetaceae bacterium]
MKVTIDRAGRVVVPKPLRDRFNLVAGTELEIESTGDGLNLRKTASEPTLTRKKGFLVHHGTGRADIDVVDFIRAERDARSRHLAPEDSG